jgi:hypothetical protein
LKEQHELELKVLRELKEQEKKVIESKFTEQLEICNSRIFALEQQFRGAESTTQDTDSKGLHNKNQVLN